MAADFNHSSINTNSSNKNLSKNTSADLEWIDSSAADQCRMCLLAPGRFYLRRSTGTTLKISYGTKQEQFCLRGVIIANLKEMLLGDEGVGRGQRPLTMQRLVAVHSGGGKKKEHVG